MLTTPLNPFSGSDLTESIQTILDVRFDYILPRGLLFSNLSSSEVFRTDLLPNPPPPLESEDDKTASDHLPVLAVFANPYTKPFRITGIGRTNEIVTIQWESVPGQPYRMEGSSNLQDWLEFSGSITATTASTGFSTNAQDGAQFLRVHRLP